jgi:Effector Associated Constant Component 1
MIVDLALKGASPDDLAVLRRLLASDGLIDRHFVAAQKYARPGEMDVGNDMVTLTLNSSSVGAAASVLAMWLSSRKTEVEIKIETGGAFFSFKSKDLRNSPAVAAELTEALQRATRS